MPICGEIFQVTALGMYQPIALNCMVVLTGTVEMTVFPFESESVKCAGDESGVIEKPLSTAPRLLAVFTFVCETVYLDMR